ncbi:MAG: hypothetical protein KGH75_01060 [Rhodospirillales bacterium]|nr:hypothetical protein [Rhodospirillales bacterium]
MSTTVFNAVIKAVDEASAPIREIAAKVRGLGLAGASLGEHLRGVGAVGKAAFGEMEAGAKDAAHGEGHALAEVTKLGSAAKKTAGEMHLSAHPHIYEALSEHIKLLRGHFGHLGASIAGVAAKLTDLLPMLGGVGAAGSFAGIFEMVHATAEATGQLSAAAEQAGLTVKQLQELNYTAKVLDVPVQNVSMSMFRLNERIGQAASGQNKQAMALFAHLGISLRDANGHIKSAGQLLPVLAEAFKNTHDPAMRARMAMVLMGRGGMELLPVLDKGSAGLKRLAAAADRNVYVPNRAGLAGLDEFKTAWINITAAVDSFQTEIGTKLAPVLTPLVRRFADWVNANRDWMASGIVDGVKEVARLVGQIDVRAVVAEMKAWGATIRGVVAEIGGFKTVAMAVGALIAGKFVIDLAAGVSALAEVAKVARVTAAAIGVSTPVGLAITAFAAAALVVYENWKPIRKFFEDMWSGVVAAFRQAWAYIQPIVRDLEKAVNWVRTSWAGHQLGLDGGKAIHAAPLPAGLRPGAVHFGPLALLHGAPAGQSHVTVTFANTPPGTKISTSGPGPHPSFKAQFAKRAAALGYNQNLGVGP